MHRLGNEWKSYQAETAQQQLVVDRLAAKEGTDEWDLQNSVSPRKKRRRGSEDRSTQLADALLTLPYGAQQRKVLSDCKQMIEPSKKRALEALQQLQDIIVSSLSSCLPAAPDLGSCGRSSRRHLSRPSRSCFCS